MTGWPNREPWDVDAQNFVPSETAIRSALLAFKEGRPVNCIQTAHMAKAASIYLTMKGNDMSDDKINHPKHYGGVDNPYETIKVIDAWGLNFNLGNTVKYISRADKKENNVQDLKKAAWYLEREIRRLEGIPDPKQSDMFNPTTQGDFQ